MYVVIDSYNGETFALEDNLDEEALAKWFNANYSPDELEDVRVLEVDNYTEYTVEVPEPVLKLVPVTSRKKVKVRK